MECLWGPTRQYCFFYFFLLIFSFVVVIVIAVVDVVVGGAFCFLFLFLLLLTTVESHHTFSISSSSSSLLARGFCDCGCGCFSKLLSFYSSASSFFLSFLLFCSVSVQSILVLLFSHHPPYSHFQYPPHHHCTRITHKKYNSISGLSCLRHPYGTLLLLVLLLLQYLFVDVVVVVRIVSLPDDSFPFLSFHK